MSPTTVIGLFLKSGKGQPMQIAPSGRLQTRRGHGIVGDVNACGMSPRQVLITCAEQSGEFGARPGDLRENITLKDLDLQLFAPGNVLCIGCCRIRLTFHCEPCKRIKHIVSSYDQIIGKRGILGVILSGGAISVGDLVTIEEKRYTPLPEVSKERFDMFARQIPSGKVVTYSDVTVGMGVADSFIRAIPGYISRADQTILPVHRIVDVKGRLLSNVLNQRSKLEKELVPLKLENDLFEDEMPAVDLESTRWTNGQLYLD